MRRQWSFTLLAVAVLCITAVSSAYASKSIPERIANQQRSINAGIAAGQLSREEAALLQENLDWIKIRFEKMTADGVLTSGERASMEKTLDKNGKMISNKKHNAIGPIYGYGLQQRIDDQERQIRQGIRSGQLTNHESTILQDNLSWIKNRLARLAADRRLTGSERDEIERMLDQNSMMIYKDKHNAARRLY